MILITSSAHNTHHYSV